MFKQTQRSAEFKQGCAHPLQIKNAQPFNFNHIFEIFHLHKTGENALFFLGRFAFCFCAIPKAFPFPPPPPLVLVHFTQFPAIYQLKKLVSNLSPVQTPGRYYPFWMYHFMHQGNRTSFAFVSSPPSPSKGLPAVQEPGNPDGSPQMFPTIESFAASARGINFDDSEPRKALARAGCVSPRVFE